MVKNDKRAHTGSIKYFQIRDFRLKTLLYSAALFSRNNIPIIQGNAISSCCSPFLKLFTVNNQIQYPIVTYIYIHIFYRQIVVT